MWNVETTDAKTPVLTNQQEIKQLLCPPLIQRKRTDNKDSILGFQIFVCALILVCTLCVRYLSPTIYDAFRAGYQQLRYQGILLSGEEELVKFANGTLQDVKIRTMEALRDFSSENALSLGYGAGGWSWRAAPEGSSLENLVPDEQLSLPIHGYAITSNYGWRSDPFSGKTDFHTGIDLAVAEGTAIRPAWNGIVQKSAWNSSYGNYVQVLHANGLVTRYCHMQYIFVRQGQRITTDDVLGTVGQTGAATGPHLHFELFCNDVRYDPTKALEGGV